MAKVLKSYLDKITDLEETIDSEIDELLKAIDIDQLLASPEQYMSELSKQFFESLDDELKQAIQAGQSKANFILESIDKSTRVKRVAKIVSELKKQIGQLIVLEANFRKIKSEIDFNQNINKLIDEATFEAAQINVKEIKKGLINEGYYQKIN